MLEKNNTMHTYILNCINILSFCLICEVKLNFFFCLGFKTKWVFPIVCTPIQNGPKLKQVRPTLLWARAQRVWNGHLVFKSLSTPADLKKRCCFSIRGIDAPSRKNTSRERRKERKKRKKEWVQIQSQKWRRGISVFLADVTELFSVSDSSQIPLLLKNRLLQRPSIQLQFRLLLTQLKITANSTTTRNIQLPPLWNMPNSPNSPPLLIPGSIFLSFSG